MGAFSSLLVSPEGRSGRLRWYSWIEQVRRSEYKFEVGTGLLAPPN